MKFSYRRTDFKTALLKLFSKRERRRNKMAETSQPKTKPMAWSNDHNIALIREILLFEPWLLRYGSQERGQVWKRIAESLNQITEICFKVDDRAVRDHFKLLEKKYKKRISEENRATGIAPPEETELDQGLREIIEQFHDFDLKHQENKQEKLHVANREVQIAEEFRQASLETFGETRRRTETKDDNDEISPKSKKRRTGSETIAYLRDRNAQEVDIKKQELDILEMKSRKELEMKKEEIAVRKLEVEERKRQNDQMQLLLLHQQEQTNRILNQQEEVNLALLRLLEKR